MKKERKQSYQFRNEWYSEYLGMRKVEKDKSEGRIGF